MGSTGYLSNQFVCEDTEDKIFLLSYAEVKNSECGFALQTSDYSRATGVYMDTNTSYYGIGYWWLRSPTSSHSGTVHAVDRYGLPSEINWVYHSFFGVVPAMWINLNP